MADQHNANIPAVGNQIVADIPDIKENLEWHKDVFGRLFSTWHDSTLASNIFGPTNGSYTFALPTNGVSDSTGKFMIGDTDTVVWMYLNAAPPGWKVLSTGADTVLAVSGGSGDYNVNGGNPDSSATWTIDGMGHTHEYSHTHKWYNYSGSADHTSFTSDGSSNEITMETTAYNGIQFKQSSADKVGEDLWTSTAHQGTTTDSGGASSNGTWRPKGSVGKLYQLDTA
jgi:hypothetical protein